MDNDELKNTIFEQGTGFIHKCTITEHDDILSTLCSLLLITGNANEMFCNMFLFESVELLKNAFFLYEEGFFDCAFYSVRQSIENINNMLFSVLDADNYKLWRVKARFPSDKIVKEKLCAHNDVYNEIKSVIPDFFEKYEDLLKQANKYIHKQGFDTFYTYKNSLSEQDINDRMELFVSFLKYGIGMILVMDIVLDPLALVLSDSEVDTYIDFNPMTEPIPLYVFEKYLSYDIVDKIKSTQYYSSIKEYFLSLDELEPAIYAVVRCNYFDVDHLDQIENQINKLDLFETFMFYILKNGIKATHFYYENCIIGYSTSFEPSVKISDYSSNQFDVYLQSRVPNYLWKGMYITGVDVLNSHLIIQHNNPLTNDEIELIRVLADRFNNNYLSELVRLNELIHKTT